MVKVEIRCPSCSKRGKLEVSEEIINTSSRGVTAVNVANEQICSHSFVAYIDKNLAVRDCFITDFQIELPQMEAPIAADEVPIPSQDAVDIDIIKMNIPALTFTFMIRAWLFGQPLLFLYDGEFLHRHVENFFKFISTSSFETELLIGEHDMYKSSKKNFRNHIVLDSLKVLNDKGKFLDPKKIKIERTIVQKFLAEYDPKVSLIIFKNEIRTAYELANTIKEIINTYDGEEKLGKKKLIDRLLEVRGIKVPFSYLEFLLDIIKNYYNFDLSGLSDYYFPAFGI